MERFESVIISAALTLLAQQHAHVVDRRERVGVIAPQRPLASLEIAAKVRLSEAELALIVQQERVHVVHRRGRFGLT